MTLTEDERNSPLWAKIRAELEPRLLKLRADNDSSLNELATEKLRGRIAELKRVIDIGSSKPKPDLE